MVTEEDEWDTMEAVKIKHTSFEQEYTFKEMIARYTITFAIVPEPSRFNK